jgi:hypothetical protein
MYSEIASSTKLYIAVVLHMIFLGNVFLSALHWKGFFQKKIEMIFFIKRYSLCFKL